MLNRELRESANNAARRAVEQTLREMGPDATRQEPIKGFTSIKRTVPTSWQDGIAIARAVAGAARGMMLRYATDARGAGIPWKDLADALGIPDDESVDRAEAAFELVAGPPSMQFDKVTTSWECASCGQYVTDNGPYDPHPDDCERGHAEDCARHLAEIRAHKARNEDY